MFSGVWCSMPTIVDPCTRMPCDLQLLRQLEGVGALQLRVAAVRRLEAHPDPADPELDQLAHLYFAIALAEENTYIDQALPCCFMRSSSSSARVWSSRKFSSIMKKTARPAGLGVAHRAVDVLARLEKLTILPFPPKNDEVVQKLQPIGQPTEGMIVAAGSPPPSRGWQPHQAEAERRRDRRMRDRRSTGSPRNSRNQRIPSPFTMWSASSIRSTPGMAATCPPTTIVDFGECSRTRRHISRTLPTFTMMPEMPTMS